MYFILTQLRVLGDVDANFAALGTLQDSKERLQMQSKIKNHVIFKRRCYCDGGGAAILS